MGSIKRINLSFNLEREDDRKAYEIIQAEKYKTDFIIKRILNSKNINFEDTIKNALREVLSEYSVGNIEGKKPSNEEAAIPNEVFDMFNNL